MAAISDTMRAVIADGKGGPEVLRVVKRPVPVPSDGEILVRVEAAGINRPDVVQREGRYPPPPGAPDTLGLEIAGKVVALGPNVTLFSVGDPVMALVPGGGYADYAVVHETNALPIPKGLTMTEAGAIPETYFTVWTNVFERGGLQAGETFLVHGGTSGIGTTAIQLAKAFGATVIATAGSKRKCDACVELGADLAINYREEDFVAAVKDVHGRPRSRRDPRHGRRRLHSAQLRSRRPGRPHRPDRLLAGQQGRDGFRPADAEAADPYRLDPARRAPSPKRPSSPGRCSENVLPLLAEGRAKPLIDSTFPLETSRRPMRGWTRATISGRSFCSFRIATSGHDPYNNRVSLTS